MKMKGNEYRFRSQNLHHQQQQRPNAIFLPMLCSRPSIVRDVHCFHKPTSNNSKPERAPAVSPKISCIGHVKRSPKPPATTATANDGVVKYAKLKKLFSGRNLGRGHVACEVSVVDLDPPLPVVAKRRPAEAESLWKRRSGGTQLQGLQLRHLHLQAQPTTL